MRFQLRETENTRIWWMVVMRHRLGNAIMVVTAAAAAAGQEQQSNRIPEEKKKRSKEERKAHHAEKDGKKKHKKEIYLLFLCRSIGCLMPFSARFDSLSLSGSCSFFFLSIIDLNVLANRYLYTAPNKVKCNIKNIFIYCYINYAIRSTHRTHIYTRTFCTHTLVNMVAGNGLFFVHFSQSSILCKCMQKWPIRDDGNAYSDNGLIYILCGVWDSYTICQSCK